MTPSKRSRASAVKSSRAATKISRVLAAKVLPVSKAKHPLINNIETGVPGLDAVLGGGLCEYSFNLVAGAPGAGKTTLVQQILFANATKARPAIYFTVLGEPTVKMVRYQQQFAFFDKAKVGSAIRFVNLSKEAVSGDLDSVLARIVAEVTKVKPAFVAIARKLLVALNAIARDRVAWQA